MEFFVNGYKLMKISFQSLASLINAFQQVFPNAIIFHPAGKADLLMIGLKGEFRFNPELLFKNKRGCKRSESSKGLSVRRLD